MAELTEKFKFTIIESPINEIMGDSIFQRFPENPQITPITSYAHIGAIRKGIEQDSSKAIERQGIFSQKRYQINRENGFQNTEDRVAKVNVLPISVYLSSKSNSQHNKSLDRTDQRMKSKLNIYKRLHFNQAISHSPQEGLKPTKNETLSNILQEIGQFKKSINQIREKLQQNIENSRQGVKHISEKKGKKRNNYEYSHENYSYTNYRDLSNRGKSNRSYDKWKSHERGFTFLKDHIAIQQFTIDASDSHPTSKPE